MKEGEKDYKQLSPDTLAELYAQLILRGDECRKIELRLKELTAEGNTDETITFSRKESQILLFMMAVAGTESAKTVDVMNSINEQTVCSLRPSQN